MKSLLLLVPGLCLMFGFASIQAQETSKDEIAIYEPEFEFLQKTTCSFVEKYNFDPEEFRFMETSKKTVLRLTPESDDKKIIKTLPKGALIKTYKFFPEANVSIAQFENSWGFISHDDLINSEKLAEPISSNNLDSPPVLLNSISAKYPAHAKKEGIMGDVSLKVHISNTGAVTDVIIEKSIPQLDSAALSAISKLRFKPAKKYGLPVDVWVRFPVQFRLKN